VVFGPVLAVLPADVPRWLSEGRFFDRPRHPTGTAVGVHDARTGNALLRRQCLDGWSNPFDPAFGLSGGEDSLFFRDLLRRGKRFVWCDEAMVSEKVPEQRANTRWLLQRSYRIGQTWVRGELARLNGWELKRTWMALAVRSGVQLVVAAFLSLVLWPLSRIRGFRWLRTCVAQWGKLTGLVGQRFHEYSN
jgi:succinoglycan biosynthesis protein ExoM